MSADMLEISDEALPACTLMCVRNDPRSIVQADVEWAGAWCKVCAKAFDRLRGEA